MKNRLFKGAFFALFLNVLPFVGLSRIQLPALFSDYMVLQRQMPIPVWGTAEPGSTLSLKLGNQEVQVKVNQKGSWKVTLAEMEAGGPFQLMIKGDGEIIKIEDILVGEVWLCSGQSNMEWSLEKSSDSAKDIKKADFPQIRLFRMARRHSLGPTPFSPTDIAMIEKGEFLSTPSWQLCGPESAAKFSGVAYYFGKTLADSLDIPIGLIQNAVGGSPIQSWISKKSFLAHPQLAQLGQSNWMEAPENHPWVVRRIKENLAPWTEAAEQEKVMIHPFSPQYLFDAGIRSLAPYAIQGVIWYQGESNATHPGSYSSLFELMVKDWRDAWQNQKLPFLFVQLPRIGNRSRWPEFRQQQTECLEIDQTGMVVAIDEGHPNDVHPLEKKVIGDRLGHLALAKVYNYAILAESPVLSGYNWNMEEQLIELSFLHSGSGLSLSRDEVAKGFRLQGYFEGGSEEGTIEPTQIAIKESIITLTYPKNFLITKISYAWAPFPENNLVNSAGLPLTPFRIELPGNY